MTTMVLLLVSGALIGTGVSLIWRDVHSKRRDTFVLARDSKADSDSGPEVEMAAARAALPAATGPAEAQRPRRSLSSQLLDIVGQGISGRDAPPRPDSAPPSATAQQWATLQPVISAAVEQVNAVLAGAGVEIGTSGEPSAATNKSYGSDRPILVGGQSVGWLRLECTAGGRLSATVTAHEENLAEINGDASAPAPGLTAGRASDLLSECLKPTAGYAVRTGGDAEQRASETAWQTVDAVVIAALKAGNGALSQAGAKLVPLALPAWDAELRHHRMPVAVQVYGSDIARMHIDRLDQEMEVAVGLPDAHLANLGRRERIALQGMTMHALAELIAGCAWPAIERYRETRRPA